MFLVCVSCDNCGMIYAVFWGKAEICFMLSQLPLGAKINIAVNNMTVYMDIRFMINILKSIILLLNNAPRIWVVGNIILTV